MTLSSETASGILRGSMTALVTPFKNGAVDFPAYDRLIERQIDAGTSVLIPAGTTGEATTLTVAEHKDVIARCVAKAAGRVPVLAGVGSNDTLTSIDLAKSAADAGADGLLAATGYYNKPTQAGLIAHYRALAEATPLPIVVYNVPSRTASDIFVETLATLSEHPNIVGVKDATAVLGRVARQRLACASGFVQLSGEDLTAVGFNAMGGQGCISVTANIAPNLCTQMQEATLEGRYQEALDLQDRLAPLHDAIFVETSPAPVKYALFRMGLIENELRLPMLPATTACQAVDKALDELGLL